MKYGQQFDLKAIIKMKKGTRNRSCSRTESTAYAKRFSKKKYVVLNVNISMFWRVFIYLALSDKGP